MAAVARKLRESTPGAARERGGPNYLSHYAMPHEQLILYHGTSRETAELIRANGFKASTGGCLGPGVYVAHHDKASKFAANCPRHGGDAGVVVKVKITFSRAKYVRGDDQKWRSEGYDACRAEWTSASTNMEWCLASPTQVEFLAIQSVPCGAPPPAFELAGFEETLSLDAVRRLAVAEDMEEVFFDEHKKVVSFSADVRGEKRFNIYYATGTVGTAYMHPKRPRMQCFRRKADMQIIGELFRAAVQLSHACGCHDDHRQRNTRPRIAFQDSPSSSLAIGNEELEVQATLEQLRKETEEAEAILRDHRLRREEQARREAEEKRREEERKRKEAEEELRQEQLRQEEARQRELIRQEEARRQQVAAEKARVAAVRAGRGTECKYWMTKLQRDVVDENFDQETLSVALNGTGVFVVQERGGWQHSGGMPDALSELMAQELKKKLKKQRSPAYVALGSNSRYYIRFTDGSSRWQGDSETFNEKVREGKEKDGVLTVAFGKAGSWFIVYNDGGWYYMDPPIGLKEKIEARKSAGDLKCVSLGSNGEWFLSAKNGRSWWGGWSGDSKLPTEIRDIKDRITYMDFGEDDLFFVRYS